jgi:hypothetical protein
MPSSLGRLGAGVPACGRAAGAACAMQRLHFERCSLAATPVNLSRRCSLLQLSMQSGVVTHI